MATKKKVSDIMYNGQINGWLRSSPSGNAESNIINIYVRESGILFAEIGSEVYRPERKDLKTAEKQLKALARCLNIDTKNVKVVAFRGLIKEDE